MQHLAWYFSNKYALNSFLWRLPELVEGADIHSGFWGIWVVWFVTHTEHRFPQSFKDRPKFWCLPIVLSIK